MVGASLTISVLMMQPMTLNKLRTTQRTSGTASARTCTKVHALKILVMIKRIRENPAIEKIIVQCDDGRSRSAAVAKFYSEKYGLKLEREPEYANSLILALLHDPNHFEEALDEHVNKKIKPEKQTNTKWRKLFPLGWIDLLLEKIFGK